MALWLQMPTTGAAPRILVADGEAGSRALLRAILEREGATVTEATDGGAALARVRGQPFDMILLDMRMPGPDGIEVTRLVRRRYGDAELPIILVTGESDTASKVAGLEAGASDFVSKPYEVSELLARVRAALRVRIAHERLESVQGVLAALANAVDAKDPSTEHHCSRLAELALSLARRAGLEGEALESIGYGAVLHDVGKIGVSELVIRKTGSLDEAEVAEMRRHPVIGAGIVAPLRLGRLVAPIVRGHHERWDGSGYPDRLKRQAIPLGARVVSVVDAYDAMIHDRPYRRALGEDHARGELTAQAGRQFDPELVANFLDHLREQDGRLPAAAVPVRPSDPIGALTRGLLEQRH